MLNGFKVIRLDKYSLTKSTAGFLLNLSGIKRYEIGRMVKRSPEWGPLAIFSDIDDARKFLSFHGSEFAYYVGGRLIHPIIVKCMYEPSEDKFLWRPERDGRSHIKDTLIPPGTKYAEAVKCLE